jgi:phosphinothricin acetyltransferase
MTDELTLVYARSIGILPIIYFHPVYHDPGKDANFAETALKFRANRRIIEKKSIREADGMPDGECLIRLAREEDAVELLSIYAPYVRDTVVTFEYDVPGAEDFAGRIRNTLRKYPYLVAESEGRILGYAYASPFKTRAAYDWAVETSIYIRRDARGRGTGGQLYRALEEALRRMNIQNLNACITTPNPESIGFHERFGYRTVGQFTQCGFKHGAWRDVVWMEKFLGDHAVPPKPFIPFPELDH